LRKFSKARTSKNIHLYYSAESKKKGTERFLKDIKKSFRVFNLFIRKLDKKLKDERCFREFDFIEIYRIAKLKPQKG